MSPHKIEVGGHSAWQHYEEADGGTFHTFDQLALAGDNYGWHKVHVWLPPDYFDSTKRHSVIYANDGEQVFFGGGIGGNWRLQRVVQETAASDAISELPIVVGIQWRDRDREYLHKPITRLPIGPVQLRSGGGLGQYSDYLADSLVGFIDTNYRTIPDRQDRVILGSSHGGLAAFFTGVSYGDVFGQVIAMSSSFWAGTMKPLRQAELYALIESDLRQVERRPRIYIDWGLQRIEGHHNKFIEAWATSRGEDMLDILVRDHGYTLGVDLMAVVDPDGHHNEDSWRRRAPEALRFALTSPNGASCNSRVGCHAEDMHTIEMQWASSTVSPDHFIMRVVEGTVLEPLTTPENYTVGTGGFVWAYPGISDEVWEREVRPVIDRRIWKLEDRLKIMSGRST